MRKIILEQSKMGKEGKVIENGKSIAFLAS